MPIISLEAAARHVATGNHRIAVVGTTGSGKTTLARHLARWLKFTHVELDALHWDPHWTPTSTPVFRDLTTAALDGAAWIIDGNYGKVRDIIWARADTVIWLDYSLPLILWRLSRRTFWRVLTQVELWNGNREHFREQFFSRDSLFLWVLCTYRRRRQEYPPLFARPEYAHLKVVHLRSPRSSRRLLAAVARGAERVAR